MGEFRQDIVAWVGGHVLPHEGAVRGLLRRARLADDEIDDIVQEAYCRIAALESAAHIADGRGYLVMTARNILLENIRRSRIVRIDAVADLDRLGVIEESPSPEMSTNDRRQLERVGRLIQALPDRCRQVFILRRIQGLSQRDAARRMGVTENVIEAQTARGLKLILKAVAEDDQPFVATTERERNAAKRK